MTVHTTYFAALQHDLDVLEGGPSEDVLVASIVPAQRQIDVDGVDRNIASLAPPVQLREAFRKVKQAAADDNVVDDPDQVAWRTTSFGEKYRDHVTATRMQSVLSKLRRRERDDGELWLVCYEKDPAYCARRVLADVLTRGRDTEPVHHPAPDSADVNDRLPDAQLDDYDDRALEEAQ